MVRTKQLKQNPPKVVVVHLRRPRQSDPKETRSDPYFEFGSFGCTGCHGDNLLNEHRAGQLHGARLAFAQGGTEGFRLILLTTPVTIKDRGKIKEAQWRPIEMPFRYSDAPILARNDGYSDFINLVRFLKGTHRNTIEACFSSRFRTRCEPLPKSIALELIRVYTAKRAVATPKTIATCYVDSMQRRPPLIERDREHAYRKRLKDAGVRVGPHCAADRKKRRCY